MLDGVDEGREEDIVFSDGGGVDEESRMEVTIASWMSVTRRGMSVTRRGEGSSLHREHTVGIANFSQSN